MGEKKHSQVTENDDNISKDDYIVKTIGGFGIWQAVVCLVSSVTRFIVGVNIISIIFLAPRIEFSCIRFKSNESFQIKNSTCYDDCEEYTYYDTIFEETIISRFGLICEKEWLASFTQSMLMFGLLIGVSVFGWISDRFGRRKAHLSSTFFAVAFMIAAPFSPNYWTLTGMRFFCGFGTGGVVTLSIVVCMEIVGPLHKNTAGFIVVFTDVVSGVVIKLIAYFSPTWDIFLLTCGTVGFILFFLLFFITESPRWLITNQKSEEALTVLNKIAKISKKSTIIVFSSVTLWFINGICFFGMSQYSTFLGLNVYLVMYITGFLEVIATILSLFIIKYVKRRLSLICNLCVIATSMSVLVFIPLGHWGCIVTSSVGIAASKLIFTILSVQANELFPTPVRTMGLALSTAGSEFGSMISPFLANARPYWLPSVIFAVMSAIAISFSLLLPETKGKKLEDTIS